VQKRRTRKRKERSKERSNKKAKPQATVLQEKNTLRA